LKAKLLLDGGTPKVPPGDLKRVVQEAGFEVVEGGADFGIVVGGDGRFGWYGRTVDIPLLFVGVRAKGATGSKAFLARTTYRELPTSLRRIRDGSYRVEEHPRLAVSINGRKLGEVFTDVYMQRGSESACIRYRVRVKGKGVSIDESAIGDGVVVSTKSGSTGYYSYPDRIKGEWMDPKAVARIAKGRVGICHVDPTYTERAGEKRHPLRYTVPWGSKVELSLYRKADARIYGTTPGRGGVLVGLDDVVTVVPGRRSTKLIAF
jgi:hypothetical protein